MKKSIIFAIFASLAMTSCIGDLDQNPLSGTAVPSENVYGDPTYRMGALAKIYGGFTLVGQNGAGSADIAVDDGGESEFLRAYWSTQEISTDAAKCAWGNSWNMEMNKNAWTTAKNSAIYATYTRALMMVSFANDFLRHTTDDDATIATERAEVRFLRAYAYWILLDSFGYPPFADETAPVGSVKPKQTNPTELFNWIKGELTDLTSDTSALKAIHTQIYPRIDKGAAYGLMARIYLNHKAYLGAEDKAYYAEAMKCAQKVIAAYPLAKEYKAMFMGDNGENPDALNEFVFVSCYDAVKTQSYGGTSYIILAGKGDKMALGCEGNWNGLLTMTEYAQFFDINTDAAQTGVDPTFTDVDKRALLTLKDCSDKTATSTDFAKGWHVVKFNNNRFLAPNNTIDYATRESYSSVDFPLMRSGEMYLIYAEAKARIDGGTTSDATAVGYINDLRKRAGITDATTATSYTLDQIFRENSRELMWEGHRRTTLIRYDKYTSGSYLWPFKGGVKNGQAISDYRKLFPLPADDVLANDNLKQNDGYAN